MINKTTEHLRHWRNSLSALEDRWVRLVLLTVMLLALLIRIYVVYSYEMPAFTYGENSHIAVNLVEGKGYTYSLYGLRPESPLQFFVPPLYTWIVWLCLVAFRDAPHALGVVHAVFGTITLPLLFYIAHKLTNSKISALIAAACTAFYPPLILSIIRPQTLTLNVLLIALLLAVSVKLYERRNLLWSAGFGLVLGMALHSRPMLLIYVFILIAWLYLNGVTAKKLLKIGFVVMMSAITVSIPWTARNYRIHQRIVFMATNGGFNFWTGNNSFTTGSGHEVYTDGAYAFLGHEVKQGEPPIQEMHRYPLPVDIAERITTISEVELDHQLYVAGFEYIREHPAEWLHLMWVKFGGFVWFRTNIGSRYEESWTLYYKYLYAALLVPFVIGVALSISKWRWYSLLYMLFGYYTVFYTVFHVQTRYRWEIEPYVFVFVALTVTAAMKAIPGAMHSRMRPKAPKTSGVA